VFRFSTTQGHDLKLYLREIRYSLLFSGFFIYDGQLLGINAKFLDSRK